jgi:adenine phosphoribosyltransferase
MMMDVEELKDKIRTIPNWPKKGVMFRDITTLLKDGEAYNDMIEMLVKRYKGKKIDAVAGIESRGFVTGAVLAHRLGVGFIPVRKPGKLPAERVSETYELEYGKNSVEIHTDAIIEGQKILLCDDLIATGGTAIAACNLIKKLGGEVVECNFIINLPDLKGEEKLEKLGFKSFSLVEFEGD